MSELAPALGQIAVLVAALAVTVPFLGRYLAHVYTAPRHLAVERVTYRVLRVDPDADQHWRSYAMSVLGFSLVGVLFLYAFGRLQQHLPLSLGFAALPADGAWNTSVSFVTNTNWQWYSGEAALGHLMQMSGLTVQNFVSAGVGMCVAAAFARGLARAGGDARVGNFFADLVRTVLRVLLPVAAVAALLLVLLGAVQNLASNADMDTLGGATQVLTGGPVASQEAIKELGTNGGGFYNVNSAHPFENPTPLSNILEIYLLLLIPFAMAWAFGLIVRDRRQGVAVLTVMGLLLSLGVGLLTWAEMAGPGTAPQLAGAAMERKETRFGEAGSALFGAATTGTSTGAVNSMHDSLTAPGGGVTLFSMMLGEIAPGGVGSGLYGMLVLAILTVFLCGLMVGRTPEYLGKKIGQREIVLVAAYVLATPVLLLTGIAVAITAGGGLAGLQESGPHGLSEALYAVTSAANNNGSAFGGLTSGTPFWNTLLGVLMLFGRFLPMLLVLALAGRFAQQKQLPPSAGTLPTHRPLFVALLTGVALVVVGLTYVPVLALGPIAESLS
ncbi:Potassium-transporting ATPase potassium-binding subunit [Nocardioides aquaticus]|uniref:Potassium-transporting ATPase potassium-binding subunit n=1 Tax=Nocardioides aquaticus TaxID=160826 RepID=A0ABX8EEM2_9ACTN|nr:potassium-transporting ATPase subunit KdpA [Nocardioides aquaticus]QVT78380.1 Potassium-transporting ATPase potassium-binding subunit [Nocardioides aquaticus]